MLDTYLPPLSGYFVVCCHSPFLLPPCFRFILLACDGLFKVFTPEEAVNFILSCLEVRELPSDWELWELHWGCGDEGVPWGTGPPRALHRRDPVPALMAAGEQQLLMERP